MPARHLGDLPSGSRYAIEVPREWNGVLLLVARPVPVGPGEPPWEPGEPLIDDLVRHGYAVAGSANTIFWPLERCLSDQCPLLDVTNRLLGPPRHTIAFGVSIGGLISAAAVQLFPDRLSGALPMCANLAGSVGNHNRELDIAFVVKTLLARDAPLELTQLADPVANLRWARAVLHEAQGTPAGRARLALAAAVGNMPGWHDPTGGEPVLSDFELRQRNQFAWFEEVCFLVLFFLRAQVETQAGGNPSWNTDVDYDGLLARSFNRDEVEALYDLASLTLADDMASLAAKPRIGADPAAVAYLERHIALTGDLGGVPVLTSHTVGDGLVTPDQAGAYGDVVDFAGNHDHVRQLYVHRGGHCTFTFAETRVALEALIRRIESGTWPVLAPRDLNAAAQQLGEESNVLPTGEKAASGFVSFVPPAFPRRHDVRDLC